MDPIVLSTMTAALTVLGTEVGKATASEAGKTAWQGALKLFGWSKAPALPELAESIAQQLQADPELARRVLEYLGKDEVGPAATLVANISAKRWWCRRRSRVTSTCSLALPVRIACFQRATIEARVESIRGMSGMDHGQIPDPIPGQEAEGQSAQPGEAFCRPGALTSSDASPESVLDGLRHLLEGGQVGAACRLAYEAANRFPKHHELQKANRILNQWQVSSSSDAEPSTSDEIAWVKDPPIDVRGKWVALIGSRLIGIADTATELMNQIQSQDLQQKPLVHHFGS